VLVASKSVTAAAYTFTNVADTNSVNPRGDLFTRFDHPAVSGSDVAFFATDSRNSGIYKSDAGVLTSIVMGGPGPQALGDFHGPAIHDGVVAFSAGQGDPSQTHGVFVGSGGPLTAIALTSDPAPNGTFLAFGEPSISGGGVAFFASYGKPSSSSAAIFLGNGGTLAAIVQYHDATTTGPVYPFDTDLVLHGSSITFSALNQDGARVIYVAAGGSIAMVADTGGPAPVGSFAYLGDPAISDGGVVFVGIDDAGQGIFKSSGGATTAVVRVGDPAPTGSFDGFSLPAIGGDTIAFRAAYGGSEDNQGIFLASGGTLTTLIKTGDPLFGSTLASFSFFGGAAQFAFDADGADTVAFLYTLSDGRAGVALASPVPEPSTFGLAGLLAGFRLACARARRAVPAHLNKHAKRATNR
jgi:hypothetical protein